MTNVTIQQTLVEIEPPQLEGDAKKRKKNNGCVHLVGGDAFDHTVHNPVDHVLLFKPTLGSLHIHLVILQETINIHNVCTIPAGFFCSVNKQCLMSNHDSLFWCN